MRRRIARALRLVALRLDPPAKWPSAGHTVNFSQKVGVPLWATSFTSTGDAQTHVTYMTPTED